MTPASSSIAKGEALSEAFQQLYRATPMLFRAPGRVNLIGEHTDYNDGFVMPAAIDFSTWVAASPRTGNTLHVRSKQYDEECALSLENLEGAPRGHWSDYVRGIAAVLQSAGLKLRGANLLIDSEVPLGAGLSSSAALELSTALALLGIAALQLPRLELVKLAQKAENQYTGAMCGIMDQFIAGFGHAGNALLLDCRSLDYSLLPIPEQVRLVICNSMVKHDLAAGEYNVRRAECAEAVKIIRQQYSAVHALRDVTPEMLEASKKSLPEIIYRRAKHVVTENQRVLAAAEALREHRLPAFGELMYASHESLRDDYEVSCRELDSLVSIAAEADGVIGARMTGGGFGGCTVNLVEAEAVDHFQAHVADRYARENGRRPDVFVCSPAEGAEQVKVEGAR